MIRRLLVANRGEISVRILRTCREMGIDGLAVYSEADRGALHTVVADRAACIGPAPAKECYLNADAILKAAADLGADAIHPGYGFLSESAEFARQCTDAGFVFVGPTPEAMRLLGDKIQARRTMAAAGVPIVPGYDGDYQSEGAMVREAKRIGYPVLIKSSAGGGGRGMRLVPSPEEMPSLLAEARAESLAATGDDCLLLERYVESAHHVEFQVLADSDGNVVHLFERECSIQRRNQKIVEETPSPVLTPALRESMANAAVAVAKTANYTNAGTVEFLVETGNGVADKFYFMEMNTRIQVEHPITEMVTGIDLVREQLLIASGEPLAFAQKALASRGHAIEARVYAENPAAGYLPSAGVIERWIEPNGPGIRVDSGYRQGDTVPVHYDAMLAKVIAHGATREAAAARLRDALERFCVLGVTTNIGYLLDIVTHPSFIAGDTPTSFLRDHFDGWAGASELPSDVLLAAAAETLTRRAARGTDKHKPSAWESATGWRNV